MVCFLCSSSNKRCSNLLYICFVLTDFWPYCGRYLCLCFSRLSEIYDEHCSNISFVKSALNEMEGGSDKSSKSNSLKATLQKECIRFCPLHQCGMEFNSSSYFWRRFAFYFLQQKMFTFQICFVFVLSSQIFSLTFADICAKERREICFKDNAKFSTTWTFCYSVQAYFAKVYLLSVLRTLNGGWKRKLKSQVMAPAVSSILGFMV